MAKTTILLLHLLISILVVADQATAAAAKQSSPGPAAEKSISDLVKLEMQKAIDAVVNAVPPAKQLKTMHAAFKHLQPIKSALAKAKESGDEKKIADILFTVETATAMVAAAPRDKKLKTMEDSFKSAAAPASPLDDCPTVSKAYCETRSKIQKAFDGVAAPAPAVSTIDKVYGDGDKKKIAQVIAAYSKAADAVVAAAPDDKLNVMEKTFVAAGKD